MQNRSQHGHCLNVVSCAGVLADQRFAKNPSMEFVFRTSIFFYVFMNTRYISGIQITIYTSCWNSQKGIYYYTTYNRRQITAVNMHKVNLDAQQLVSYAMLDDEEFYEQN